MVRKLNNKGITLIELIVSFTLVAIAIIYFYQTLYTVKNLYSESQNETKEFVDVNYAYRIIDELNKNNNNLNSNNLCDKIKEYKEKDNNFLVDNDCDESFQDGFKIITFKINKKDYSMYFYNNAESTPIVPSLPDIENPENTINYEDLKAVINNDLFPFIKDTENSDEIENILDENEEKYTIQFNSFEKTNIDNTVSNTRFWLLEEMDAWVLLACNTGDLNDEWCNIFNFSIDEIAKIKENIRNGNYVYCIFKINNKYVLISNDDEFNEYLNDYYIEMLGINYIDYFNNH